MCLCMLLAWQPLSYQNVRVEVTFILRVHKTSQGHAYQQFGPKPHFCNLAEDALFIGTAEQGIVGPKYPCQNVLHCHEAQTSVSKRSKEVSVIEGQSLSAAVCSPDAIAGCQSSLRCTPAPTAAAM